MSLALEDIGAVHSGGTHPDEDFARPRFGPVAVPDRKDFGTTRLGTIDVAHGVADTVFCLEKLGQ